MMRLISLKTHTYAKKERTVGEAYDADDQDAKALCAVGHARAATEDEEEKDQEYLTRDMTAAPKGRSRRHKSGNGSDDG